MTRQEHFRFWGIGLALSVLVLWLLRDMILPFVAGMAIAYFLDPVADRLESWRVPRWLATTIVLASFAVGIVLVLLLIIPIIQAQAMDLIAAMPGYAEKLRAEVIPLVERFMERLSPQDVERLREAAGAYAGDAVAWIGRFARGVLAGSVALFDVFSLLFITPIVAFYLLRDWNDMMARIDGWLPRRYAPIVRAQAAEVDRTLAGFVRGQASVCLILGLFYAVGLTVVGLDFGFVIGLTAGLLSFIPYVGSLIGFGASIGVALVQFDAWTPIAIVAGVFFLGQALEGNFLTPRLVGGRVGLHPVWVIFALLAGASLFGFVGVLLAVPVAAIVGVGVRFALGQYRSSPYYTGEEDSSSGAPLSDADRMP